MTNFCRSSLRRAALRLRASRAHLRLSDSIALKVLSVFTSVVVPQNLIRADSLVVSIGRGSSFETGQLVALAGGVD